MLCVRFSLANSFIFFIGLLCSTTLTQAEVTVELNQTDIVDGFTVYVLTATSDDSSENAVGIDAGLNPSTYTGFQGVNQIYTPSGLSTPSLEYVALAEMEGQDMTTDSHFLISTSQIVSVVPPFDGPEGQNSSLNGILAVTGAYQAPTQDFAQIAVKGTNLQVVPGLVPNAIATVDIKIGTSKGSGVIYQASIIPEPATLVILGIGALSVLHRRT